MRAARAEIVLFVLITQWQVLMIIASRCCEYLSYKGELVNKYISNLFVLEGSLSSGLLIFCYSLLCEIVLEHVEDFPKSALFYFCF